MGGTSGVDGKDLVRRYLADVFSGGNLAAMDTYLRGDAFMKECRGAGDALANRVLRLPDQRR